MPREIINIQVWDGHKMQEFADPSSISLFARTLGRPGEFRWAFPPLSGTEVHSQDTYNSGREPNRRELLEDGTC
jgi:hypothetical protein